MGYTREGFNRINNWRDLSQFIYDRNITYDDAYHDIIVEDCWIEDEVRRLAAEFRWGDIGELLRSLYNGNDHTWYILEGNSLYKLEDDDFNTVKFRVLQVFESSGLQFDEQVTIGDGVDG